jgi:putative nucleotidyltransferase with HDIG domain
MNKPATHHSPPIPTASRDLHAAVADIVGPVYLVGGSVRDLLLGHEPHDYDFTTPRRPDEVEAAIRAAGKRPYLTGKRFGTVGFKLGEHFIEITTFREESYVPGSRKPQVRFVPDITYDLSRRDFTINALARRLDGHLIDPFGGRGDLSSGIIRTVGKPEERFHEDPLRMLRAARFASQFNFSVDAVTELRANHHAHQILLVSHERWSQELDRLLVSAHPQVGLNFLARTRLLNYLLPELALQVGWDQDSPYHELPLWEHSLKVVQLVPAESSLRWAALLHDVGKPFTRTKNKRGYSNYVHHEMVGAELTEQIGRRLRWSNEQRRQVVALVREHLQPGSPLEAADGAATKA